MQEQFHRPGPGSPGLLLLVLIPLVLAACASTGTTPPPTLGPAGASTSPTASASTSATASPSIAPSPALAPTATPTAAPTAAPTATPTQTPESGVWTLNVYDAHGFRYQNPDLTACTAASAQIMLNMATTWTDYMALAPGQAAPTKPDRWKVDVSYTRMETLLAYQRKNGTMLLSWGGADAHGWRNALNYYGWGSIEANV